MFCVRADIKLLYSKVKEYIQKSMCTALLMLGLGKAIAKLEWFSIHLSMNIVMNKKTELI